MLPDTPSENADSPFQRPSRDNRWINKPLIEGAIFLRRLFEPEAAPAIGRKQLAVLGLAIVLLAIGVRWLHWQDKHVEIVAGKTALSGVFNRYLKEANRINEDGSVLFPREQPQNGDARLVAHPPGYSILIAAILRFTGNVESALWFLQVLGDAAAVLLVFLIGLQLLNWWLAVMAAMFVALSPHLAHYSLILSPDSLAVLPILVAVYLVAKGIKRPAASGVILAGSMIGLSCWLTANALLLSGFLAISILLVFPRGQRVQMALILLVSTIVVVAPLTIRNLIVFHRFIPLSIQAGLSLVEGIGDYDTDGTFGMPRSDREAIQKDAEWNDRPDYGASLWVPDGIDRDHVRLKRGLDVVRSNPLWFASVIFRRATFMLSYNDSRARQWPLSTASISPITSETLYGHEITPANAKLDQSQNSSVLVLNGAIISGVATRSESVPLISIKPVELEAKGVIIAPLATAALSEDGGVLEISGNESEYGDQFSSASFEVKNNTDYLLEVPLALVRDNMALKVTSVDQRTSLCVVDIGNAIDNEDSTGPAEKSGMTTIRLPFASGARTQVRVVVSNNGRGSKPPVARLGAIEIFEIGATPHTWTSSIRKPVRSIQRKFTTGVMLTLISLGLVLLLLARMHRALVIILVVPLYYLALQSPLHTEYRYILPIHYFLFIAAGASVGCLPIALFQSSRWFARSISPQRERPGGPAEPASANSPQTSARDL